MTCPNCGGPTTHVSRPQVLARGTQFPGGALTTEARYGLLCDGCMDDDAQFTAGLRSGTPLFEMMTPGLSRDREGARELGWDK
jgi:hypothetical protein